MTNTSYINSQINEINNQTDKRMIDIITELSKLPKEKQQSGAVKYKEDFKASLLSKRFLAQSYIDMYNYYSRKFKAFQRLYNKGKARGVTNILLDRELTRYSELKKAHLDMMAILGNTICIFLDLWQLSGAVIDELFDLCCTEPKIRNEILKCTDDMTFSEICFVYNIDYNHYKGDIIEFDNYAPFTHCIKEHHLNLLKSATKADKNLRNIVNEKMFELFPEIKNSAITVSADEYADIADNIHPLSDNMRIILKAAIKKVIVDGDETDNKLTTFVNAFFLNAIEDNREETINYLSKADDTVIDEWLNMVVPERISEDTIIELMKAIDYYM